MDEHQILNQISTLVDREHELRSAYQRGDLTGVVPMADLIHESLRWAA